MTGAEALAEVIETNLPNLGYSIFINHVPDQPDNSILIYEIGSGRLEPRKHRSGKRDEHPRIEVRVRGVDSTAGGVLKQLSDMFESVYGFPLSDGQKLLVITKSNTIGFAGQEQQTRRYHYAQQFLLTISE
jgi:hypothetical protein